MKPHVSPLGDNHQQSLEMQADYARWCQKQKEKSDGTSKETFAEAKLSLIRAFESAPDKVAVPYELTPQGERLARFRRVCDPEFMQRIDRTKLKNHQAFDSVANWDGKFPGPLAQGKTGTAKTRAAWSAIARLWVTEGRAYAWFPVKRLITEFTRFESKDLADEFFKWYGEPRFNLLLVDDADKINWQFESEAGILFQFYDWIYRSKMPCITTTNRNRAWWMNHAGDAFVRRLFDDAHQEIEF